MNTNALTVLFRNLPTVRVLSWDCGLQGISAAVRPITARNGSRKCWVENHG